jgi:hypothetical protein
LFFETVDRWISNSLIFVTTATVLKRFHNFCHRMPFFDFPVLAVRRTVVITTSSFTSTIGMYSNWSESVTERLLVLRIDSGNQFFFTYYHHRITVVMMMIDNNNNNI